VALASRYFLLSAFDGEIKAAVIRKPMLAPKRSEPLLLQLFELASAILGLLEL
jgi:hypothetical protein